MTNFKVARMGSAQETIPGSAELQKSTVCPQRIFHFAIIVVVVVAMIMRRRSIAGPRAHDENEENSQQYRLTTIPQKQYAILAFKFELFI